MSRWGWPQQIRRWAKIITVRVCCPLHDCLENICLFLSIYNGILRICISTDACYSFLPTRSVTAKGETSGILIVLEGVSMILLQWYDRLVDPYQAGP